MTTRVRGSDSRCCDEDGAPFRWRDFVDEEHGSVQKFEQWLGSLAPFARAHEEGEIEELFDLAAKGQLWDSADAKTPIKPIRLDPELFELRRKALSRQLRFYHAEPCELPTDLIKLHRHIKTTASEQQEEIHHAAAHYGFLKEQSFESEPT